MIRVLILCVLVPPMVCWYLRNSIKRYRTSTIWATITMVAWKMDEIVSKRIEGSSTYLLPDNATDAEKDTALQEILDTSSPVSRASHLNA